ncbi:MAG: hypothetical protein H5T93_07745 [Pseudothermotoga sp.]|nr:hypothetical protein [Pseudothermotoga sp.]HBT39743.1 hypothetical protein [Pseudothermotoga sp.]HCO97256.1 hypothetical protein [Pseudothermotoga sp.]
MLIDAVVGMCIISAMTAIVFFWTKNQRTIVERLYISDLAARTVVNVLVRDLVKCDVSSSLNGFELVGLDGKIVLKINDHVFGYRFEGEKR